MCPLYICVHWPWTHELSPIDGAHRHTHRSTHVTLFLFYIFVSTQFPLHSELCGVFQAGISPASPGEESRAWGWAPATSLLAVIVHNTIPTSTRLCSLNSCHSVVSNLRQTAKTACMIVYVVLQHMLMYKTAEVQIHFVFADACSKIPHKTHTQNKILNRISKTDVPLTHKTIQEAEQWLLFVVSDKKSAVQVGLVFVKQKDYSYILNQKAHKTTNQPHCQVRLKSLHKWQ